MKSHSYMTRAMRARDPRFARILGKLGYDRRDMVAIDPAEPVVQPPAPLQSVDGSVPSGAPQSGQIGGVESSQASASGSPPPPVANTDDLTGLRAEYQAKVGKRAYHGWDAAELRKRIAETQA